MSTTDAVDGTGTTRARGRPHERWLVALDIDGTIMHEDGAITRGGGRRRSRALAAAGHEVMLATGRRRR